MKMLPLQLVVIDLEDGRRGAFIGRPLVPDSFADDDCQVENVWFTSIQEIPEGVSLASLTDMAMEQVTDQIESKTATRQ
jgi:hypothetical protein